MQKQSRQNTQTAFYSPQPAIYSPSPFRQISSPGGPRNSQNFLLDSYSTKHQDQDSERLLGSSLRFTLLKDSQQQLQNEISVLKNNLLHSRMSGDSLQFNTQPLDKLLKRIDDNGSRKTEQIRYDPPMTYRADDFLSEMLSELSVISVNAKKLQNQRSNTKLQMLVVKDIRELILGWNKMHNIVNQVCQATQLSLHQLISANIPSLFRKDELNKLNALVESYQNIYPQSFEQLYQIIQAAFQAKEQDYNKIIEMNALLRSQELSNKELNTKSKNLFTVITKLEAKVNKLQTQKTQLEITNKNFSNQLSKGESKVHKSQEIYNEINRKNQASESQSSLDSKNNHRQLEFQYQQLQELIEEKERDIIELKLKNETQKEEYEELIKEHSSKIKQLENENKQMKVQISRALDNEKQLQRLNQELHVEHNQWKEEQGKKIKLLTQEINDLKIQQNKRQKNREEQQEYDQQQLYSVKSQLSSFKQAKEETEREYQQLQQKFQALKQSHQELSDQRERDQERNKQIIQQLQSQNEELESKQILGSQANILDDFHSQQEYDTQQRLIKQLELELKQTQTAFREQQIKILQYEDETTQLNKRLARMEKEHQEQIHILDNTIQSKDHLIQQYESSSRILNDTPDQQRSKSVEQSTIQGHLKSQIDSLNKSIYHYEQQIKELTRAHNEAQEQIASRDKTIKNKNQELSTLHQQLKEFSGINQKVLSQERTINSLEKQIQTLNQTINKQNESISFKEQMIEAKQHEVNILQSQKKDSSQQIKQQASAFDQQIQKLKHEIQELQTQIKQLQEEQIDKIREKKDILQQLSLSEYNNNSFQQQILQLQKELQNEKEYQQQKFERLHDQLENKENLEQQLQQQLFDLNYLKDNENQLNERLAETYDQIQVLENKLQQQEIEVNKERSTFLKELQQKIDDSNTQLLENQELVTQINSLTQENLTLKERLESMSKDCSVLQHNLIKEVEELRQNEIQRNAKLKENNSLISDLQSQIQQLKKENETIELQKIEMDEKINQQAQENINLKEQIEISTINCETMVEDTRTLLGLDIAYKESQIVLGKKRFLGQISILYQEINNLISEIDNQRQQISLLQEQLQGIDDIQKVYQNLNEINEKAELQKQIDKQEIMKLQNQLEENEYKTQNLSNELKDKQLEIQTLHLQIQIAQQEVSSSTSEIQSLNEQNNNLKRELSQLRDDNQGLHQGLEQEREKFNNLQQQNQQQEQNLLQQLEDQKKRLTEIEQLKDELKNQKETVVVLQQTVELKEIIIANNSDIITDLDNKIKIKNEEIDQLKQRLQQSVRQIEQISNEKQGCLAQQHILENQVADLETKIQQQNEEIEVKTKQLQEANSLTKQNKLQIIQDAENLQQQQAKYEQLLDKQNQQNQEILDLKRKNQDLINCQMQITNKLEAENAQNKLIDTQQDQIRHLEQKISLLENEIHQKTEQIEQYIKQLQELEQLQLIEKNEQQSLQNDEALQHEKAIEALEQRNNQLNQKNEQLQIELKTNQIKLSQLEGDYKQQIEQISLSLQQVQQTEIKLQQETEKSQKLEKEHQDSKLKMGEQIDNLNSQITALRKQLDQIKEQLQIKEQDINGYIKREDEAMKLFAAKDSEILALQSELEARPLSVDRSSTEEHQNSQILSQLKLLFGQENILDYLKQFKSQHEKQCERKFMFFKCLQSLFDEYLRNLPATYFNQNFVNLSQQEQNDLSNYSKDIQLMKAKLPVKTVLSNIKEEKEEDLSFNSNEKLPDDQEKDLSDFIDGLNLSAIVKDKKENSTSKQQLSRTEEVSILKSKLEASNEENLKIIGKFQTLLERLALKEEEIQKLNLLARDYKHKLMAMQKTAVDPQAVHAKAHLRDCLRKFLIVCGPKVQNYDLGEAILNTLFQFLEFADKDKEDLLDELVVKPLDKKKGIVQILFKK